MQLMSAYIEVQYHGDLKVGRDVVMVVLEDVPELVLDTVFLARHGADGFASDSDRYLFGFTVFLSLMHAGKCLWAAWKLRGIARKVDAIFKSGLVDGSSWELHETKAEAALKELAATADAETDQFGF